MANRKDVAERTPARTRRERLAAALRANLKRRKTTPVKAPDDAAKPADTAANDGPARPS